MFTPLEKRSAALEHRLLDMNAAICDMYKYKSEEDEMMELTVLEDGTTMIPSSGEEEEKGDGGSRNDVLWTPVGLPKQNKVVCVGRICNEVRLPILSFHASYFEGFDNIHSPQSLYSFFSNVCSISLVDRLMKVD